MLRLLSLLSLLLVVAALPGQLCLSDAERALIVQQNLDNMQQLGFPAPGSQSDKTNVVQSFLWPVAPSTASGAVGASWICQFVDHDPGPGLLDWSCGDWTYDGHRGTDICSHPFPWLMIEDEEAEIVAMAAGTIINKSDGHDSYSCALNGNPWNAVYIRHTDNSVAWYGHLKEGSLTCKPVGATVIPGEYLGIMASSGNSTGPHLHIEIYDGSNNLIDPYTGTCNGINTESWWAQQPDYVHPGLNRVQVQSTNADYGSGCNELEQPNLITELSPGDDFRIYGYYSGVLANTSATIRLLDPADNVVVSRVVDWTEDRRGLSWWNGFTLPAGAAPGAYRAEISYLGVTDDYPITVLAPNCGDNHPDYDALIALFSATNGTGWSSRSGWEEGAAGSSCNPCDLNGNTWFGVICDAANRVTNVNLTGNGLTGSLPQELVELTELTGLQLNNNSIGGPLPPVIGQMTALTALRLGGNALTGNLPDEIGDLTNLTELELSYNQLSGPLPTTIGQLTNLEVLLLSNNQLLGGIVSQLGQCVNLSQLELNDNTIGGGLPPALGNLTRLTILLLGNNNLSQTIPSAFGQLTRLQVLGLQNNNLFGELPPELGEIATLRYLFAQGNQLTGTLPDSYGSFSNLVGMDLSANALSGCVPATFSSYCGGPDVQLTDNPRLPYQGDFTTWCQDNVSVGAPCNDNDPTNGGDFIQDDCGCAPAQASCDDGVQNGDEEGVDCGGSNCAPCPCTHPDVSDLMALYNSTNGDGWTNNSGWGTDCSPCGWFGINCSGDGRVLSISLVNNNLTGTMPISMGGLSQLDNLNLSENTISGGLPADIGTLTNLSILNINRCGLNAPLPNSLGDLSGLIVLDLSFNRIPGPIPTSLADLVSLATLSLMSNRLTGTIPPQLGQLIMLENLLVNSNNLTGGLPPELGQLTRLRILAVDNNDLTGTIPTTMGNLSNLRELSLHSNAFSGSIPPELGNLSEVQFVALDANELTGEIPDELSGMTSVSQLLLSLNQLSGCYPGFLCNVFQVNLLANPALPFSGDVSQWCDMGIPQIGAPCDDGDPDTQDDVIDDNCNCVGTPAVSCSDGIQNGSETGIDCGGPDCPPCCNNLIVTTTNDSGPGSLRRAIETANGDPALDQITFNIPGPGPHLIVMNSSLPRLLDEGISIDATTQPGYQPGSIQLIGANSSVLGLQIWASGVSLFGLWITDIGQVPIGMRSGTFFENVTIGAPGAGNILGTTSSSVQLIQLSVSSGTSENVIIQDNWLGITPTGEDVGGVDGIRTSGRSGVTIIRNEIANNGRYGIVHDGGNEDIVIRENRIYCNGNRGIWLNPNAQAAHPPVQLTAATLNGIRGTAPISSGTVDFFVDRSACQNCGPLPQGNLYLGQLTLSGATNFLFPAADFQFPLFEGDGVTATITDAQGTSAFATCQVVTASCSDGIQNGSETGIDCGGPDCAPCSLPCDEVVLQPDVVVNNFNPCPGEAITVDFILTAVGNPPYTLSVEGEGLPTTVLHPGDGSAVSFTVTPTANDIYRINNIFDAEGCTTNFVRPGVFVSLATPVDPPDLACGASSPTTLEVVWDVDPRVEAYELSIDNGTPFPVSGGSYLATGLQPGTPYDFSLTAFAFNDCGDPVAEIGCLTDQDPCADDTPTIQAPITTQLCADDGAVDLTLLDVELSGGAAGVTITWYDDVEATDAIAFPENYAPASSPFTVFAVATNGSCASAVLTVTLTFDLLLPPDFAPLPTSLCSTDDALTLPDPLTGESGVWTIDNATIITELDPRPLGGRTVLLTFTPDDLSCSEPFEHTVSIGPGVTLSVDCASTSNSLTVTWNDDPAAGGYRLRVDGASPITVSGGSHTLTGLDPGQSVNLELTALPLSPFCEPVTVTLDCVTRADPCSGNAPPIFPPTTTEACPFAGSVDLTPLVPELTGGTSGLTVEWFQDAAGTTRVPDPLRVLVGGPTLTVYARTNDGNCVSDLLTVALTVLEPAVLSFSGLSTQFCATDEAVSLPATDDAGISGTWYNDQSGSLLTTFDPASFAGTDTELVFYASPGRCADPFRVTLRVIGELSADFTLSAPNACAGEAFGVQYAGGDAGAVTYAWSSTPISAEPVVAGPNPSFVFTDPGTAEIELVVSREGCSSEAISQSVTVEDCTTCDRLIDCIPVQGQSASVLVLDTFAAAGDTLCLPVLVADFTGFVDFGFTLGWDAAALSFVSIDRLHPSLGVLPVSNAPFVAGTPGINVSAARSGLVSFYWQSYGEGEDCAAAPELTMADGAVLFELCLRTNFTADSASVSFVDDMEVVRGSKPLNCDTPQGSLIAGFDGRIALPPFVATCDRRRDSLALVALYHATGGADWSSATNWLSDRPLEEWFGVATNEEGCVLTLDLDGVADLTDSEAPGGVNLSGPLPDVLGDLLQLENLYLTDNYEVRGALPPVLFTLPALRVVFVENLDLHEPLPSTFNSSPSLEFFVAEYNQWDFADLLPGVPGLIALQAGGGEYALQPQDSLGSARVITATEGETLGVDLGASVADGNNNYAFYRDDQLVQTSAGGEGRLSFAPLTPADQGVYFARVTNAALPDVELYYRGIEIRVEGATCDDGIQNGQETGVDCGGPDCAPCPCEDVNWSVAIVNFIQPSCNLDNGMLEADVFTGGTPPYTFRWSNGAITPRVEGLAAGSYSLTVSDVNGCTETTEFNQLIGVRLVPECPQDISYVIPADQDTLTLAVPLPDIGDCPPDGLTYRITGATTASGQGALTALNFNLGVTTILYTTGEDSCSFDITVERAEADCAGLRIELNRVSGTECFGDPAGVLDLEAVGGSGNYGYRWAHGPTTPQLTSLENGVYLLEVIDLDTECSLSMGFWLRPSEPDCDPGEDCDLLVDLVPADDYAICPQEEIILSVIPGENQVPEWRDGPDGPVIGRQPTLVVNQPGAYEASVTDTLSGCTTDTIILVTPDLTPPTLVCRPDTIVLLDLGMVEVVELTPLYPLESYDPCTGGGWLFGAPNLIVAQDTFRAWEVTGSNGITARCTTQVSVVRTEAPTFYVAADRTRRQGRDTLLVPIGITGWAGGEALQLNLRLGDLEASGTLLDTVVLLDPLTGGELSHYRADDQALNLQWIAPDLMNGANFSDSTLLLEVAVVLTGEPGSCVGLTFNRDWPEVSTISRNGQIVFPSTVDGNICLPALADIGGQVLRHDQQFNLRPVGGVELRCDALPGIVQTTTDDGRYRFADMLQGEGYTITPSLDVDDRNGVTLLDLVTMRNIVIRRVNDSSPRTAYQFIAADIRPDGRVSLRDLVTHMKLLVGTYDTIPENTSYRLVDRAHVFPEIEYGNGSYPNTDFLGNFPEIISIGELDGPREATDFIAVKIGDVNFSSTDPRPVGRRRVEMNDRRFRPGDTLRLLPALPGELTAADLRWAYDPALLTFVPADDRADKERPPVYRHDPGRSQIRQLYTDLTGPVGLTFVARAEGHTATGLRLLPGSRGGDADERLYELQLGGRADSPTEWTVSVAPNPAEERVTVRLEGAGPGNYELTLSDATGRTVLWQRWLAEAGSTTERILSVTGLPPGLYLLRVSGASGQRAVKLIKR